MEKDLQSFLKSAAGREIKNIAIDNPYRSIGFDEGKKRLGWIKDIPFSRVRESLENILSVFEGKKNFIFVGMGGSINGIKPLFSIYGPERFYVLDNLDPKAISGIIEAIDDLGETLVISISKSGTTKETQLLSRTLKEIFANRIGAERSNNSFLWLSDFTSFEKLDRLGWQGIRKTSIQFDAECDIGGRFSSPHTLIFILPLFLLLGKDFDKLERIYNSFISMKPKVSQKAVRACEKVKDKADARFSPHIDTRFGGSLSSWIVQLFQESLGSKLEDYSVKTLTNTGMDGFSDLSLSLEIEDKAVSLMCQMYFFQCFIAYFCALRNINFVNQSYVEKYKDQMRKLQGQKSQGEKLEVLDLDSLAGKVKESIKPQHQFIEVVLYFSPEAGLISLIKDKLAKDISGKITLVFVGSDWNHQSYQAAFADKDTFYVLLLPESFELGLPEASGESALRNVAALELIARATYLTIRDKSLLARLG